MKHTTDASARVYLTCGTLLFVPALTDTFEATYDPQGLPRTESVDATPAVISRALHKSLAQFRITTDRFDDTPELMQRCEKGFELLLSATYAPQTLEAIYRELRFVEVLRIDGEVTFVPKVGDGTGWFRSHNARVVSVSKNEARQPHVLVKALFRAMDHATVDIRVFNGERPLPKPGTPSSGSLLVDLVMPTDSIEERADAADRWFRFLKVLMKIVDEEGRKPTDEM